jgi:hypothetical protein
MIVSSLKNNTLHKGFVLPFTMLISTLVLFIAAGSLTLLTKQLYFSKVYKQSQTAYYAADDAIACATAIDDTYIANDGLGIFSSSTTVPWETYTNYVLNYVNSKRAFEVPAQAPIDLNEIECGQSPVFDVAISGYATSTNFYEHHYIDPNTGLDAIELGVTSIYKMKMDLGPDPNDVLGVARLYRCAKVTINKSQSFRQIIAQGYAECDNPNGSIERAVVNTTDSN